MATSVALIEPSVRQIKSRYLIRSLATFTAAGAVAWLLGFGWFLYLVTREAPPAPHVDAIVVLTGGPDRVDVALRLLLSGAADRLLVSGAGEKTDLSALAHLASIDPAPLESQITLGHAARSTHGNALETASWAREQGVATLVVVTSWFHMPRALVEMRRAMPAVTAHPHPVGRLDAAELVNGGETRRVIGEYHKYLAALAGLTGSPLARTARGTE
jgi:uncharacterized SAM-binding protein YcdF (DUF218 family)